MMMRSTLVVVSLALTLLAAVVHGKEELVRRRDLSNLALAWDSGTDEEKGRVAASFVRSGEWGTRYSYSYSKSSKGPKGTTGPKGAKGPKGSKGLTGSKGRPPYSPPNHSPYSSPNHSPYSSPNHSPYSSPNHSPYSTPPPYSTPSKCPEIEDKCTIGGGDDCPLHATCKPACVPRFCKLPPNHHKIHPWGADEDKFVKLGNICGYMKYVPGEPLARHQFEVCCEAYDNDSTWRDDTDDMDYAQCSECKDCIFPQKVNDACCKFALSYVDEDFGRDGSYHPYCEEGEVCCKCGPHSYKCIPEYDECDETDCPPFSTSTMETTRATSTETTSSTTSTTARIPGTSSTSTTPATTPASTSTTTTSTTPGTTSTTTSPKCPDTPCPPSDPFCINGECKKSNECNNYCDNIWRRIFGTNDSSAKCCPNNSGCTKNVFGLDETIFCSVTCGGGPNDTSEPACLGPDGNDGDLPQVFCKFRDDPVLDALNIPLCQTYIDNYCDLDNVDPFEVINNNSGCDFIDQGIDGSPVCTNNTNRICCDPNEPTPDSPIIPDNCDADVTVSTRP